MHPMHIRLKKIFEMRKFPFVYAYAKYISHTIVFQTLLRRKLSQNKNLTNLHLLQDTRDFRKMKNVIVEIKVDDMCY